MNTRRVIINLPEEQITFLQKRASDNGETFTDALCRAITLEEFLTNQEDMGNKFVVATGHKLREIVRV